MSQPPPSSYAAPVRPGEILAGKYRVERVLGQGGMGVVVAATHVQLGDRVALKFLLPDASTSPDVVARFLREAQAAVKIKGEHVARVSDVGTLETGAPYIVMEYLEGNDLGAVLRARGPLGTADVVHYILQACEALAAAHAAGIVHRDLKPANLFLTTKADGSPLVKVLDFGISKLTVGLATDVALTKTSALMGSPLYMSPEQMRAAREVDARSDIWSLGVVMFELLTGKPPFEADTLPMLCALVFTEAARPLLDLRPDAPPELGAIVARCLQRDLAARFQSISEVARALGELGGLEGQLASQRVSRIAREALPSVSSPELMVPSASSLTALSPGVAARVDPWIPATSPQAATGTSFAATTEPSAPPRRGELEARFSSPARSRGPIIGGLIAAGLVGAVVMGLVFGRGGGAGAGAARSSEDAPHSKSSAAALSNELPALPAASGGTPTAGTAASAAASAAASTTATTTAPTASAIPKSGGRKGDRPKKGYMDYRK